MVCVPVPPPWRIGFSVPALVRSQRKLFSVPSHVNVGEVSVVGWPGPPVMDGAAGIVESIVRRRLTELRKLPALSTVRTRQSSSSFCGSAAARPGVALGRVVADPAGVLHLGDGRVLAVVVGRELVLDLVVVDARGDVEAGRPEEGGLVGDEGRRAGLARLAGGARGLGPVEPVGDGGRRGVAREVGGRDLEVGEDAVLRARDRAQPPGAKPGGVGAGLAEDAERPLRLGDVVEHRDAAVPAVDRRAVEGGAEGRRRAVDVDRDRAQALSVWRSCVSSVWTRAHAEVLQPGGRDVDRRRRRTTVPCGSSAASATTPPWKPRSVLPASAAGATQVNAQSVALFGLTGVEVTLAGGSRATAVADRPIRPVTETAARAARRRGEGTRRFICSGPPGSGGIRQNLFHQVPLLTTGRSSSLRAAKGWFSGLDRYAMITRGHSPRRRRSAPRRSRRRSNEAFRGASIHRPTPRGP